MFCHLMKKYVHFNFEWKRKISRLELQQQKAGKVSATKKRNILQLIRSET